MKNPVTVDLHEQQSRSEMDFPEFQKFEIKQKVIQRLCFTLYDAIDRRTEKHVSLKVLDPKFKNHEHQVMNFLNGARIIKHLNHPNICRVFDLGSDAREGHYYIATETLAQETLRALILEEFSLSISDLVEIFSVIGKALRYAHLHGLVHGFLNPDCIYVKPDGAVKIEDFGFSWHIPNLVQENTEESRQFARYMAPECFIDIEKIDGRGDIYSLGLILHELLTGKHPVQSETVSAIRTQHLDGRIIELDLSKSNLPIELESIVKTSTARNVEARYQNLKEYVQALESLKKSALDESEVEEVHNENIDLTFGPAQNEKYFDDTPAGADTVDSGFEIKRPGWSFMSKKVVFSALAAVALLLLIFLATDYVSLPFWGSDTSKYGELTDLDPAYLGEDFGEDGDIPDNMNNGNKPASETNAFETENLLAAENTQPTNDADIDPPAAAKPEPKKSSPPPARITKKEAPVSTNPKPVAKKPEPARPMPAANTAVRSTTVSFYVKSGGRPLQANVFLDNSFVGKTDQIGKLEVNGLLVNKSYYVRVSKEGYTSATQKLLVAANMPQQAFDLKARTDVFGTIILDAIPRADEIYIDGVLHKGRTPTKVSLKHGQHTIKLVSSQLNATWEQKVDLKIGQILRVKHDFTKADKGIIAVSLKNAAQFGFGYVYVDGRRWEKGHNTTPLELKLTVGSHTIELKRPGFNAIPKDVIIKVEKGQTKYVSFTFTRIKQDN